MRMIPLINKIPLLILYSRSLCLKNIAAVIIVGRGVEKVSVVASPIGMYKMATNEHKTHKPLTNPCTKRNNRTLWMFCSSSTLQIQIRLPVHFIINMNMTISTIDLKNNASPKSNCSFLMIAPIAKNNRPSQMPRVSHLFYGAS